MTVQALDSHKFHFLAWSNLFWMLDQCLSYFPGTAWAAVCTYMKRWEDRYVFNLKETGGFVCTSYILVLHLHSSLHSFHSEAQTVYMVYFPGVRLNPGKEDDFSKEACLGNCAQMNGAWAGANVKSRTVSISVGCLAADLKQGLLLVLPMPHDFLARFRIWCPWAWDGL